MIIRNLFFFNFYRNVVELPNYYTRALREVKSERKKILVSNYFKYPWL